MFNENELHVLLLFLRLVTTVGVAVAPVALVVVAMKMRHRLRLVGKGKSRPLSRAFTMGIARSSLNWLHSSDLGRGARLRSPLLSATRADRSPEVSLAEPHLKRPHLYSESVFSTTRAK